MKGLEAEPAILDGLSATRKLKEGLVVKHLDCTHLPIKGKRFRSEPNRKESRFECNRLLRQVGL